MSVPMVTHEHEHEHEFEAALGLPELLPSGERVIWQGAPDWRTLAVQVMHVRTLAIYFVAMLLWRAATLTYDGAGWLAIAQSMALLVPLALVALGLLIGFAWLTSKTTVYTMTNKRVVMRIGIVLSVTFNLPYRMIESVSMRPGRNGAGDIALVLTEPNNVAYGNLWPHARPWKVRRTEPMLRSVVDAARVGRLLAAGLQTATVTLESSAENTSLRSDQKAKTDFVGVRQGDAMLA